MTAPLYHYTCSHGAAAIAESGLLLPNRLVTPSLVWLTDLDVPDRYGLGLTMHHVRCDRTEHRIGPLDAPTALHWPRAKRALRLPVEWSRELEMSPGALPMHWWVSAAPVPVAELERAS